MGADHSRGPREFTDPAETWEKHGFRIKFTTPAVPARSKIRMLEDIKLLIVVECKKPVPLRTLSAYCWTNVYHKDNPEGVYHVISLPYMENSRSWDDWGVTTYKFSTIIYPTHNEECRFSFYAKLNEITQWVNKPEIDHILEILPPRDNNVWSKHPSTGQITKQLYIGNYQAARQAVQGDYDLIIRFCDKVPKKYKHKEGEVEQLFHTINRESGAGSEIMPERLFDSVKWIANNKRNYNRILVTDEFGLGRVGSALTAYIFAHNPHLTFDEAYSFVQRRKEVFCHKGLRETLNTLYPRE